MKATVQMYGLIIAFTICVLIIPQLIGFSVCYKQCNSIASYSIEVIEVNEGLTENAQALINELESKYPKVIVNIVANTVSDRYKVYTVTCNKDFHISIIDLDYTANSSKISKRVIY
jgi:hypothetical protein